MTQQQRARAAAAEAWAGVGLGDCKPKLGVLERERLARETAAKDAAAEANKAGPLNNPHPGFLVEYWSHSSPQENAGNKLGVKRRADESGAWGGGLGDVMVVKRSRLELEKEALAAAQANAVALQQPRPAS